MRYIPLLVAFSLVSSASIAQTPATPGATGAQTAPATATPIPTPTPVLHGGASPMVPGTTADATTGRANVRDDALTTGAGAYVADTSGRVLPQTNDVTTPTHTTRPGAVHDGTPGITPTDPDTPVIYRTVPESDPAAGATPGPPPDDARQVVPATEPQSGAGIRR